MFFPLTKKHFLFAIANRRNHVLPQYYQPASQPAIPNPSDRITKCKRFVGILVFAIILFFVSCASPQERLQRAVTEENLEQIKEAISAGADVNADAKNFPGSKPLQRTQSLKVAKLLIENGADVNVRSPLEGVTPLHMTLSIEFAKLLVANGADINAKDENGNTPLITTKSEEIAKFFINKGADLNTKNQSGNTPLHTTKSSEIAKLLIENKADINAKNNNDYTPLLATDSSEIAKLLIEKGANINAKDQDGNTPLHKYTNDFEMIKLLISKGANRSIANNKGELPIDYARRSGNAGVLRLLGASETEIATAVANKEQRDQAAEANRRAQADKDREKREQANRDADQKRIGKEQCLQTCYNNWSSVSHMCWANNPNTDSDRSLLSSCRACESKCKSTYGN